MMAEGGIQAADKENDSPAIHYLDAFGGGHFAAKPELLYRLVNEAPEAIQWLNDLGVEFDKDADGTMITTHGGGTSRKRMHAAKDLSLIHILEKGAEELITACPLCMYNLDANSTDHKLPVRYFTELLAEALGVK